MITVYVKRFNRETDDEPHIESYEIEEFPGVVCDCIGVVAVGLL